MRGFGGVLSFVIAGLFVLATEFLWAERLLEFTKKHVKRWTDDLLQRIADGQWPYRDFWCNYLPGQPLVQA